MVSNRPKTVQIYLLGGNARGVCIAKVTSRTVQAVQVPRQKLGAAEEREEIQRVGVYFLFGDVGDDASRPPAYVGEAENCLARIQRHHERRDFWATAVAITSKTRSFTKAHARRLEYDCIRQAKKAQRFRLENTQTPREPHIPEPMLAELRDNFGTIEALLSMLGFPVRNPLLGNEAEEGNGGHVTYYCRGSGAEAEGRYTEDGMVVLEGSAARLEMADSAPDSVQRRRRELRRDGVLAEEEEALVFQQSHAFNSPSGAAGVVLGRSSNGWREWEWRASAFGHQRAWPYDPRGRLGGPPRSGSAPG